MEVCPENASRVEVLAPSLAAWVSAEYRSWCGVHGPPGRFPTVCAKHSATRR